MIHSRITGEARTTLPEEVRAALALKEGDVVAYYIDGDHVVLTRADAAVPTDPFVGNFSTFTEWASEADERAYANL